MSTNNDNNGIKSNWVTNALLAVIAGVLGYGALFAGWMNMADDIVSIKDSVNTMSAQITRIEDSVVDTMPFQIASMEDRLKDMPTQIASIENRVKDMPTRIATIEAGVDELCRSQTSRVFTVVPEERAVYSSAYPRLFEIDIPPNAVSETTTFAFDQNPVIPLPGPLATGYETSLWTVALGSDTSQFNKPFSAKVMLDPQEVQNLDQLTLLHWSADKTEWSEVPFNIERDVANNYLLDFSTTDLGLYTLALGNGP